MLRSVGVVASGPFSCKRELGVDIAPFGFYYGWMLLRVGAPLSSPSIDSSRPKEVSQSEIKISIIFFLLVLLVRPSIHFYTKMSLFNVKLRCKYLTVLKSDFRQN